MTERSLKQNTSGQMLIVSALLIALLLISTAIYVIDVGKKVPIVEDSDDPNFAAYQGSIRNALISTLANLTNGGTNTLSANLESLKTLLLAHSYRAILTMDYTVLNTNPYSNGTWISWGTNGQAISSGYATYAFNSSSTSGTSNVESTVNVTSSINYIGTYTQLVGNTKQVDLDITVLNENKPALAQNFTFYGDYDGSLSTVDWTPVNSIVNINHYDGTYAVSFNFDTANRGNNVYVSVLCHDQRGIFMVANATCTMV
jgi:hypothetical protein